MEKTFIKITNRDIFDRLEKIDKKNDEAHLDLMLHQAQTNGKVKLNTWRSITALSLCVTLIVSLISCLIYFN